MAKIRFKHNNHDTIKQLFVKKKTFRILIATQILTLLVLGLFAYKLSDYGYFAGILAQIKLLIKSIG